LIPRPLGRGVSFWFFVGHFGKKKFIEKHFKKRIGKTKDSRIKRAVEKHTFKTFLVAKFTPSLPIPTFVLAGASKLPYKKFVVTSVPINLIYSTVIVFGGYFFGKAFVDIILKYLKTIGIIALGVIIIVALIFFIHYKLLPWAYEEIGELSKNEKE
jgi:membrane protein DedA with SNARE-associated domain